MKSKSPTKAAREDVSVAQALKRPGGDLRVKEKSEITIGPDADGAEWFHRIRIESFQDLQRMSFVPEGLDERRAMEAVARDNEAAFEMASRSSASDEAPCGCDGERADAPSREVSPLRARYARLRSSLNPQLARALSEVYRREVQWDDPIAIHAYRWIDRWVVDKGFSLGAFVLRDIVVAKNSTLNIAPQTQIVLANDIRIHTGGKIRTLGSYMKIRCASIQGNLA